MKKFTVTMLKTTYLHTCRNTTKQVMQAITSAVLEEQFIFIDICNCYDCIDKRKKWRRDSEEKLEFDALISRANASPLISSNIPDEKIETVYLTDTGVILLSLSEVKHIKYLQDWKKSRLSRRY